MSKHSIFFGDIHNHNSLGYGKGSLERSIDIAKTHLDFFAFTGHASWHDIHKMEGNRQNHWLAGFKRHLEAWPKIQALVEASNRDGEFVQFLGYEWHSSIYGDHCVVFPADGEQLYLPDTLADLRRFCRDRSALMIPHHIAYPTGNRGVNWSEFHECDCTPVVEIFSEHGNSEYDRGMFPFVTHSFGGRVTANTAHAGLSAGRKFGFVASSDNHLGFPGAYGEGVMGVLAEGLARDEIMRAIRARRTYAITGDRIELELTANGLPIGADLPDAEEIDVAYAIAGKDELEMVEVVHNGRTIHRIFAEEKPPREEVFSRPVQLRLEWGWGPWKDLELQRITDWEMSLSLRGGRIRRFYPCLQSGPFSEEKRHRFNLESERELKIRSYTSRRDAYREYPNQSVVLELDGTPETELALSLSSPCPADWRFTLGMLFEESAYRQVGPFPKESLIFHRLTPLAASRVSGSFSLKKKDLESPGYLYFRVRQRNGQMAWSSPWFLGSRPIQGG